MTRQLFSLWLLISISVFLAPSFALAEIQKKLADEVGDWTTQINSDPKALYQTLSEIENHLSQYDSQSQEQFWNIYCQTAVRLELNEEVVALVDKQLNDPLIKLTTESKAQLLICAADAKQYLGKRSIAIEYLERATKYSDVAKNDELLVSALVKLGEIYSYQSHFNKAQQYLQKAFKISERIEDNDAIQSVNSALANFYTYQKQYDKALVFYKNTLADNLNRGHSQQAAITYYNLGVISGKLKKYQQAIEYFEKSKSVSIQVNDIAGIAYANKSLASNYIQMNEYQLAEKPLQKAITFFTEQKDDEMLADLLLSKSDLFSHKHKFDESLTLLNKALTIFKQQDTLEKLRVTYEKLAIVYERLALPNEALTALQAHHEIEHRLHVQETQESTQRMRVEFQYELKEAENKRLKTSLEAEKNKLRQQKKLQIFQIGLIVVAVLLIFFIVYHLYRQKQYGKKMRELAMRDDLTHVPNRRAILSAMKKAISWSERYDLPFSIAIFDIDHFKNFNDTYGHDVGDKVLNKFAQLIATTIRATDEFGRIGGEEFLLIMPNTSLEQSQILLNRLFSKIRETQISANSQLVTLTASAGLTEFNAKQDKWADIYNRADAALYLAKNSGRDQYRMS